MKMKVIGDAARDPSGFLQVTLECPRCKSKKVVRRAQVSKRINCAKCAWQDQVNDGVMRLKRKSSNATAGGNALGAVDRKKSVVLCLIGSRDGCRLACSNQQPRRRAGVVSQHQWEFKHGGVPEMVLDTVGRYPKGSFLALASQIDALIKLLKGE